MNEPQVETADKRQILKATLIALSAAVVILFVAILPAEFGIDPTGIGNALGITRLSGRAGSANLGGNRPVEGDYREDTVILTVQPMTGLEYKFRFEQGVSMLYAWSADGELDYDFHGDTKGTPNYDSSEQPVSYEKKVAEKASGSFVAPMTGRHGWWWANYSNEPVTVTLKTAGFYEVVGDTTGGK